jgi:heme/copper-type cytochrome/quinol oxidase subunit 2
MSLPLADAIFWVAVACCAVAQWFILRGAFTASMTPQPGATVPTSRRPLEIAWAVLPAVALAFVLAATWRAMHPHAAPDHHPAPEHTAATLREAFPA